MAKVTGKLQVTIPKAAATACGIAVGDTLDVHVHAGALQLVRRTAVAGRRTQERLAAFDQATRRQNKRDPLPEGRPRGWTREELYRRGRAR